MAEPTSSLERTLSRDSADEPQLFLSPSFVPPVARCAEQVAPEGSPRACSPAGSPDLRKWEDKLEAAAARREDSLAALTKRCGAHVQRCRCAPPYSSPYAFGSRLKGSRCR